MLKTTFPVEKMVPIPPGACPLNPADHPAGTLLISALIFGDRMAPFLHRTLIVGWDDPPESVKIEYLPSEDEPWFVPVSTLAGEILAATLVIEVLPPLPVNLDPSPSLPLPGARPMFRTGYPFEKMAPIPRSAVPLNRVDHPAGTFVSCRVAFNGRMEPWPVQAIVLGWGDGGESVRLIPWPGPGPEDEYDGPIIAALVVLGALPVSPSPSSAPST